MSHLTEQDRRMIANLLNAGLSPLAIAHKLKRAHSTITRELRKHRREDEENQKHKKNFCNRRLICHKRSLCRIPPGNCPGHCSQCKIIECRKYCDEYEEEVCMKLDRPPDSFRVEFHFIHALRASRGTAALQTDPCQYPRSMEFMEKHYREQIGIREFAAAAELS